jgi:rod shape-determining protein MreD
MKLSLLFLAVGFVLVLLQTTILHLLPLGPIVPDLALVLCVYWGLNYPTVAAALGSFILGYSVDVFSSPLLGLNAFALSMVFLAVYLSSRCIWIHDSLLSAAVVFAASWVKALALLAASSFFLAPDGLWRGLFYYVFVDALAAAALAPLLFFLLRRGQNYVGATEIPS